MIELDGALVYSASDLATAATCEFALVRTLDVLLGRAEPTPRAPDAMLTRTAELGAAHERRVLQGYLDKLGPASHSPDGGFARAPDDGATVDGASGGVVVLSQDYAGSTEALRAANDATFEALRSGADVVYQGTFFDGRFTGRSDFLVRAGLSSSAAAAPAPVAAHPADTAARDARGITVVDTKLARHARVTALLQVTAYADQLIAGNVAVSDHVELILGDNTVARYPLADLLPVYRERRRRLEEIIAGHGPGADPVAWGDPGLTACGGCPTCTAEIAANRDVLLVAGLRSSQRTRLIEAGICTIEQLAQASEAAPGIPVHTWNTLTEQARMQVAQEGRPHLDNGQPDVASRVFDFAPIEALAAPNPGDVFFDFEGDPLWAEPGSTDWGLEYLFGVLEVGADGQPGAFRPFWAHDRPAEKRALTDFLDYITERRALYPGMHVYHYAPYEKTALARLVGRHGTGDHQLDELLRAEVLVDLYATVRQSVRVSQPSYSIKKLEPLYMNDDVRSEDLDNAADSIAEYALACDLRDAGEDAASAEKFALIEDYNRYDCLSTLRLRDWLLAQLPSGAPTSDDHAEFNAGASDADAHDASGASTGAADALLAIEPSAASQAQLVAEALGMSLLGGIADIPAHERTADEQAIALLAAALHYNSREDKPFWWEHFDRLKSPVEDWAESRDVFLVASGRVEPAPDTASSSGEHGWFKEGRQRVLRRHVRLVGRFGPGTTAGAGSKFKTMYADPAPGGMAIHPPALRAIGGGVRVQEVSADYDGMEAVTVVEMLPADVTPHAHLPLALVPDGPVNTANLQSAIEELVGQVADHRDATSPSEQWFWPQAGLDVLRRANPRLTSGAELPILGDGPDRYIAAVLAAVSALDHSYLGVQGPPGTGKTYVGARVIAALVERGWRVGVVAQSHAVVENLLDKIVDAGVPPRQVGKETKHESDPLWTHVPSGKELAFLDDLDGRGGVVGGTAWVFSNATKIPRGSLDLLVIDEAGQFCLAHTLAVSVSARNLLLLGDPQQLPQVSQGSHPEPVDGSALGWVTGAHQALPGAKGYFLDHTWRMHPELCEPVSRLSYEGRLTAQVPATTDRFLAGVRPGVHVVPVVHSGNSVASYEEADVVVAQVAGLVGRDWTHRPNARGPLATRPLEDSDILVVAAFNAQRALIHARLKVAGFDGVKVGTVDKFQGQEAPVVIVSMAASSADDVPRGIGFLLQRNRVNVAVSRGQWAAFVVRSPRLTAYLPASPDGLLTLGAFIGLCDAGTASGAGS